MFTTILIFIALLGLLVFVHELGHFVVGKLSGMKIEEFGFGFPPRLFGIQKVDGKIKFIFGHPKNISTEHTVYSVNLIPLGGFVKILGENGGEDQAGSFSSKKFLPRFLTLFAGVAMNVVFAWFLISITLLNGLSVGLNDRSELPSGGRLEDPAVSIVGVQEGSPADTDGLIPGDIIVSVDTTVVEENPSFVKDYIQAHKGSVINFKIERAGEEKIIAVKSLLQPEEGKGSVGITMALTGVLKVSGPYAFMHGVKYTWYQIENIGTGLYQVFTSKDAVKSLGGPVKIAQITGEVAKTGFTNLVQFAAFLSLNLAVLNTLPIPALDGGRILFLFIEKIRGKKNNVQIEQVVNTVGFLVLLLLMFIVTIKDLSGVGFITRLFS